LWIGAAQYVLGMTISEYGCEDCGYTYQGCGGLGVLMSGEGFQTVSCSDCKALHDVKLGVNLRQQLEQKRSRKRGPGRRVQEEKPGIDSVLATLSFACPVNPSHTVRPWTGRESGGMVPDAIVSVCPVCEGRVRMLRTVMEAD
jgi:hypothetical protein